MYGYYVQERMERHAEQEKERGEKCLTGRGRSEECHRQRNEHTHEAENLKANLAPAGAEVAYEEKQQQQYDSPERRSPDGRRQLPAFAPQHVNREHRHVPAVGKVLHHVVEHDRRMDREQQTIPEQHRQKRCRKEPH